MDSWEFVMRMRSVLLGVYFEASPELESLGLQPKSFTLLASIDRIPFPAALAKELFVPPPTITFMVKQLEKMKLLTRETESGDLRKYRLRLTKSGRDAVEKGKVIVGKVMKRRVSRLPAKEAKSLLEILKVLQNEAPPGGKR